MEQLMNRKLQELELTSAQGHVIGFLRRSKEPPCARDIETAFGLSHATVSGINYYCFSSVNRRSSRPGSNRSTRSNRKYKKT